MDQSIIHLTGEQLYEKVWSWPGKLRGQSNLSDGSGTIGCEKPQTLSAQFENPLLLVTESIRFGGALAEVFPLPWPHYVRLMSVENPQGRAFYESEAIRGGWSVGQLDRQISTQFFERTVCPIHAINAIAFIT